MSKLPGFRQGLVHVIGAAALVAIAMWGYQLRWVRAAGAFDVSGGTGAAPTWLIDDPDAAYHLRRVEVALASGSVPSSDQFLSYPQGSAVPWPPFFDGVLATGYRLLAGGPGAMGITDEYEAELEAQAVALPPLLGFLATLAVGLATALLVRRSRPDPDCIERGFVVAPTAAALVGALIYATVPLAIWYSDAGRIDHHVLVALLFALHLGVIAQVFACGRFESDRTLCKTRELDATLGGMAAGLLAGFALLTWLASAVFVAIAGLTFWLASAGGRAERAEDARRAAVLYFATAASVTLVPAWSSPWNLSQPWSLVNLTMGVPVALLIAAVCLGLPRYLPGRGARSGLRSLSARIQPLVVPPLVAVVAFFVMPGFADGVREGLDWAGRGNLFMDVVDESRPLVEVGNGSLWRGLLTDLGWAGVALPLLGAWLLGAVLMAADRSRGGSRPEARLHLWLNLIVFGLMTIQQRRFGNSMAVPLAIAVGCMGGFAMARFENGYVRNLKERLAAVFGILLTCALLVGAVASGRALEGQSEGGLDAVREQRREVIAGLRWMRTHTPSAGPVHMAEARQSYSVLSAWGMGHMLEYHARRPIVATNFGSFVGERNFQGAALGLLARGPEQLAKILDEFGAEYVVVTPRMASELASFARIAQLPKPKRSALFTKKEGRKTFSNVAAETAVWRLALDQPGAEPSYPGLERVYASDRRESLFGGNKPGPGGPMISIWKRVRE